MSALFFAFLLLMPADDSPLVKAAKVRKLSGKVITNADVKKAAAKPQTAMPPPSAEEMKGPLQKQDEQRHARVAAVQRVDAAEKKVIALEAELRRLEQAYYEESDLDKRDGELVARFDRTWKQLDDAKKELSDARDALKQVQ
ncbi:MAG TPA: hypothetical protein VG323_21560 [Thermoanaerobaculia bacterium]|nr:hypothetical protein [Thermoanaerobaculia bacterium]